MILTKYITMNLHYRGAPVVVEALQGDSGRALEIRFMAGDEAWQIPEGTDILMQYRCQNGTGGIYDSLPDDTCAYAVNGNALTVYMASALCAVAGETKLQITLLNGGHQISTFPIVIRVMPRVCADTAGAEYTNLMQWWLSRDAKGDTGDPGVYLGATEPENPEIRVWIYPEGDAANILKIRDEAGNWVDIPAIVGPRGEPGIPGAPGEVTAQQLANHTQDGAIHATQSEKNTWNAKQDALSDYIVEQGISGIWYYRKWNSGVAECWGRYSGTVNLSRYYMNAYYSDTIDVALPFTFTQTPLIQISGGSTSTINWAREFASQAHQASFIVIGNEQQTGVTVYVNMSVNGKWR